MPQNVSIEIDGQQYRASANTTEEVIVDTATGEPYHFTADRHTAADNGDLYVWSGSLCVASFARGTWVAAYLANASA